MPKNSSVVINVPAPRVADKLQRVSARSVVDALAARYRNGVARTAAKLARASNTRDAGYAVSEGSTEEVVAKFNTEGGRYSYSVVQTDGVASVVRSRGVSDQLDLGSIALGEEGDIATLPEQTNADLLEGISEDAVTKQLKAINRRNRRIRGSGNMSAQAADEMMVGTDGESELVPEGGGDLGETMDASAPVASMQAKARRAWSRWSPSPRPHAVPK